MNISLPSIAVLSAALLTSAAGAQELLLPCPTEGLFTGPPQIIDMPNPLAGWDFFLEGTLIKVELSPPAKPEEFWLFTCYIGVGGTSVAISAHMAGRKACRILPNGGVLTTLQNGSQSCLVGGTPNATPNDRCVVTCR
jgi:hypothetical protein